MLPRNLDYAAFVSFAQADKDLDPEHFQILLDEIHTVFLRNGHRNENDETFFLINHRHNGNFREQLAIGERRSVCLLSLYSPNYWDSPECTLERTFFIERNLRSRYRLPQGANHIDYFAVPWIHRATYERRPVAAKIFPDHVPQKIRDLAYFRGEEKFPTVYAQGLLATLTDPTTRDEGRKYARQLATEMSKVVEQFANTTLLPANAGRKGTLYVLAATPGQVEERISRLVNDDGIKNIEAGRLEESKKLRVEAYRFGGGADWHPFAPTNRTRSIRSVVEAIIGSHVQELASPVEPQGTLPKLIAEAEDHKEYVIVVIDPWSLFHFERLMGALADLDEKNFKNCMLLVVKGPSDLIYAAQATEIERNISVAFERSKATSILYREIASEQALRTAIRDLFHRIRLSLGAEAARNLDTSGPNEPIALSNAVGG